MHRLLPLLLLACVGAEPDEAEPCVPGPGASGSPTTIDEAVALIGSLPRPVTIACFVQALDRPLPVVGTTSQLSAQPAAGDEAPRIFTLHGDLTLSIALVGEGSFLLELSEAVSPDLTLKAELAFPIEDDVAPADAYDRIQFEPGTSCGFCHLGETAWGERGGVTRFASEPLRPLPETVVDVLGLARLRSACDRDTRRCDLLRAVFDHGPVVAGAFDPEMATITDR